jgi:hypothetical protein
MSKLQREDLTVASPIDDRDEDSPDFPVQEEYSCTNTDFGGGDPAADEPTTEIASELATFDPSA